MIEYRVDRITRQVVSKHQQGEYAGDNETDAIALDKDIPLPCYQEGGDILPGMNPNGYKWARVSQYPSIEDQLDMIYHDHRNGTSDWLDMISQIKENNPKPEGN